MSEDHQKLCDVAEALGLLVPEAVPFLEGHARTIRERLTLAEAILTLIADLEAAYHKGWGGIVAARTNAVSAGEQLTSGQIERAHEVYRLAHAQYETSRRFQTGSISEELRTIADRMEDDWPDHAREIAELARKMDE